MKSQRSCTNTFPETVVTEVTTWHDQLRSFNVPGNCSQGKSFHSLAHLRSFNVLAQTRSRNCGQRESPKGTNQLRSSNVPRNSSQRKSPHGQIQLLTFQRSCTNTFTKLYCKKVNSCYGSTLQFQRTVELQSRKVVLGLILMKFLVKRLHVTRNCRQRNFTGNIQPQ